MSPAEADAILAWLYHLDRYRDAALLRIGSDGAAEVAAFRAQYPEIQAALNRLAEIAKESQ